jgi:hypothetical protein
MSGTAAFAGELNVTLIDSFSPALGATFDLFDFVSSSGAFTSVNLPALAGGLAWSTSNLYTTGEISVVSAGGSPYDTWASGFPGFSPTTPGLDFDNDGLSNLLEFVLGGNPTTSQSGIAPSVTVDANNLVITFKRSDASETDGVAVKVQTSTNLSAWGDDTMITAIGGSGPNGITYTITESVDPQTLDTVVVTIPKASASRKFVRVVASK